MSKQDWRSLAPPASSLTVKEPHITPHYNVLVLQDLVIWLSFQQNGYTLICALVNYNAFTRTLRGLGARAINTMNLVDRYNEENDLPLARTHLLSFVCLHSITWFGISLCACVSFRAYEMYWRGDPLLPS